jgi:hypothetical protein
MQYADIPAWLGILSFIVGLAITVAMGKYAARHEERRREMRAKVMFETQPAGGKLQEEILVRSN